MKTAPVSPIIFSPPSFDSQLVIILGRTKHHNNGSSRFLPNKAGNHMSIKNKWTNPQKITEKTIINLLRTSESESGRSERKWSRLSEGVIQSVGTGSKKKIEEQKFSERKEFRRITFASCDLELIT
ncbi:hypothetical protein EYC80_002271 [Monilinia laxa]|uniref:Uncharacterized protein n=1 Tax=Monilinia laxa TaxID=61186 RepID=A0A5N6K3E3_MONLA|nr:hypothetical protein EYC80_002271 [Monilinia laxa]